MWWPERECDETHGRRPSRARGECVVDMGHDYARGERGGKRGAAVVQAGGDCCAAAVASATAHRRCRREFHGVLARAGLVHAAVRP